MVFLGICQRLGVPRACSRPARPRSAQLASITPLGVARLHSPGTPVLARSSALASPCFAPKFAAALGANSVFHIAMLLDWKPRPGAVLIVDCGDNPDTALVGQGNSAAVPPGSCHNCCGSRCRRFRGERFWRNENGGFRRFSLLLETNKGDSVALRQQFAQISIEYSEEVADNWLWIGIMARDCAWLVGTSVPA